MKMKKFLNKHLPLLMVIAWVLILAVFILFVSCMPDGYKKDVVWHRITNVEVIEVATTIPPYEKYKITIDDTIEYVSGRKYVIGDSVPFIYIAPSYTLK